MPHKILSINGFESDELVLLKLLIFNLAGSLGTLWLESWEA